MNKEKFFIWLVVKRHLAKNSLRGTRHRYNYIFRWLGRKKLNAKNVEALVLHLREKGLRNSSINYFIRVVRLIDLFEQENGKDLHLLKKVSYFPKQRRVPTILSIEEIEAILAVKKDYSNYPYKSYGHDIDRTYRNAIWFLAGTGCRYDEMASIKKGDLSLGIGEGFVIFRDTKTNEDRKVPLPPLLVEELKNFTEKKNPNQFVFTTSTGHKIAESSFNPELRKRVEMAGIQKHVYAHCFRNSYIMEHIRNGTEHLTISKLVGHKDPKTTLWYTQYSYDDLIKGAENHPLFSRYIEPKKLLIRVKEAIEKFPIRNDYRFGYTLQETKSSLVFKVYIK